MLFRWSSDHTLANVYILLWLAYRGKKALAVDDFFEMELILPGTVGKVADFFPYFSLIALYFSLIALTGTAEGVTIHNAKYTLENHDISPEWQFGVSNEPLPAQTAEITLRNGALLLIRDR